MNKLKSYIKKFLALVGPSVSVSFPEYGNMPYTDTPTKESKPCPVIKINSYKRKNK